MAADLTEEKSGFETRAARSLRPAKFEGKDAIAAVLARVANRPQSRNLSGVIVFLYLSTLA